MTVGEFKKLLEGWDDDWKLTFGMLEFNRLKIRGDKLVDMEFFPLVYKDDKGEWQVVS